MIFATDAVPNASNPGVSDLSVPAPRGILARPSKDLCVLLLAVVVTACPIAGAQPRADRAQAAVAASLPDAPPNHSLALRFGTGQTGATAPTRFGNVVIDQPTPGTLPLTLDEAIDRGLRQNLQIKLATQTEQSIRGQILNVFFNLLPNVRATAYTNTEEINLAALGFKPSSLAGFAQFGLNPTAFHTIVKVDTTAAQLSADQVLFNVPDLYLYLAAKKAGTVVQMNTLNARGGVILAVGSQYLAALADQAQIANAQALVQADEEVLRQAMLSHDAGVATNLDVLRAQVQLQTEQQALIRAQNQFAKDKIALTRLIGLPADQEITLTDAVPYAELAETPLEQAKATAYARRKDLLGLEGELEVMERAHKAAKFERLPSVSFNGFYGVLGETRGLYHGVFTAQGVLKIPIFEEARFRGEEQTTAADIAGLRHQIDSLKETIDGQIRSAMLDVQSSAELVKVARSNVDLATEALSDTRDRFRAGVTDNLPVVQAQAALTDAQSRLVAAEFRYNLAKLQLARNSGVIEINYKHYLGR